MNLANELDLSPWTVTWYYIRYIIAMHFNPVDEEEI
jgi:hypothetical protein